MSSITKLQILGVRSFSNQHSETLKFETPLTLIVGYNGSGKTTIIECLKYATTGILPQNSKTGGAFIHDPNLCGEKEVLAQVKIEFKASTGARMVATRSLQLIVKKSSRSQKTLEGQLLIQHNGERSTISTRVAELDLLLPQYLGVSTAVLDNVIFCHQDDSLWPLSEPAVLKRKFDEIFEAQKYTKAIENIKVLRKKYGEELAKYRIIEQHAKEDKDRARRVEKKSLQLHEDIKTLKDKVKDLEKQMSQAEELANKAWKESEGYAKVLGLLEGKRIEAQGKTNTIRDLKLHLKEVSESDEWLHSTLDQFEARLEQYQEQKEKKQEEYMERREVVEERRACLGQKHNELGEHEHAKADHGRQVDRRKEMVRAVASKHGLRGYDDLVDDSLVEEFMFKIKKIFRDHSNTLERVRTEANTERKEAQSLVNRLTERKAALQDSKTSAKKQMALNDREAQGFQKQVDQIFVDEGSKAVIESRIDDVDDRLKKGRRNAAQANWDLSIKDSSVELRKFEEDTTRLNHELIQGTKKAGDMAKLSHLKQEVKDRNRSLKTLMNTHSDRINKLIGKDWKSETVEKVHDNALTEAVQQLSSVERVRDGVARELEQVQFKLKTVRNTIEQKTQQMNTCEKQLRTVLDGSDPAEYQTILAGMQTNLDALKSHTLHSQVLIKYFQEILHTADDPEKPQCRTCQRSFSGGDDPNLKRMKKRIGLLITNAARQVNQEEIRDAEAEFKEMTDAAVPLDTYQRLKDTEIPALQDEQNTLSQQRQKLNVKMEDHDRVVEKHEAVKDELEQMSRPVASIAKCQAEIISFESQVEELSAKQSQHGSSRTLEDVQQDISSVAVKIESSKKTIAQLTTEKEQSRGEISSLDLELSDLKSQLNTASFQLDKKAGLVARVEEFRASNKKQRDAIDKADSDIDKLEPEIATAQAKYDDIAERAETAERDLSRKSSELSESVNALNLMNDQIKSYIDRDVPAKLANTKREIKRIEQEIKHLETEQNDVTRDINKITEQLRDSENTKRQYSDNLRYRQECRALATLVTEIEQLAERKADVDRDRLQQESAKRTKEFQKLSGQQSGMIGEMKSKDVQLVELMADYETDLKDAPQRYKEAHIRVETTKAAVEDLGRYGGALDQAIMKYHGLKMEEVNRIIEELWQKTYQGTDVDTIFIKTDSDVAKVSRSYQYRVVMVKQDAEMDMRGRCSAGQKVLASIIIRLALAECFGVNCGLIALDEPTTNLDQDNIRSLAEALHGIIKYRQAQANFQLIVITHDEEFLRQMSCGDFVDNYYRVSRDSSCNSVIEKQGIAGLL